MALLSTRRRPAVASMPRSLGAGTSDTASPRPSTIAVMVCTRDRPAELESCLGSLARTLRPDGCDICLVVVDNAAPSQEVSIRALAQRLGVEIVYANEPVRGYSSPRNRALELALAAGADILVFIDDDVLAEPDLVLAHARALAAAAADVSMGGQTGKSIGNGPLLRKMKVATFNVAFRRWLVEPSPGAGLRFDTRLNLTGYEDHEFFYEAQNCGARVVRNDEARVSLRDSKASITQKSMSDELVARYVYATGRNWGYVRQMRRGALSTWPAAAWIASSKAVRVVFNAAIVPPLRLVAPALAQAARRQVIMDRAFISGLGHGLTRGGVERAAAKRGEIIEIVET